MIVNCGVKSWKRQHFGRGTLHDDDEIYWGHDLDLSVSRDVISHVTIRISIGHFRSVVHWNQVCISIRFRDTGPLAYWGHDRKWLQTNCPDFIRKDQWPPSSPDLNPMDYRVWGAMLEEA